MEQERDSSIPAALGLAFAIAAAAIFGAEVTGAFLNPGKEAAVTAKIAGEMSERACIAQYGPGERWTRHRLAFVCARGTYDVPAHVLSYPLAAQ